MVTHVRLVVNARNLEGGVRAHSTSARAGKGEGGAFGEGKAPRTQEQRGLHDGLCSSEL